MIYLLPNSILFRAATVKSYYNQQKFSRLTKSHIAEKLSKPRIAPLFLCYLRNMQSWYVVQSTAKVETWKPIQNCTPIAQKKIETWHIHGSALFEKLECKLTFEKLIWKWQKFRCPWRCGPWFSHFSCQFFNNVQILASDRSMVFNWFSCFCLRCDLHYIFS